MTPLQKYWCKVSGLGLMDFALTALIVGFIHGNLDPFQWPIIGRAMMVLAWLVIMVITFICVHDDYKRAYELQHSDNDHEPDYLP